MSTKYIAQVNTICQDVSDTLQDIAFKKGYSWKGDKGKVRFNHEGRPFLVLTEEDGVKRLGTLAASTPNVKCSSIEEFLKVVSIDVVKAGDYEVTFLEDGIMVNNIKVTKETVKEIWERLQ